MGKRERDRLILRWRDRLWLGRWKVRIQYAEPDPPQLESSGGDAKSWEGVAWVETMPRYRSALVQVVKEAWDDSTPAQQNGHICHEMIHVVLDPLDKLLIKAMQELPPQKAHVYEQWRVETLEGVTSDLTTAFLDAYKELKGS